MRRYAILAAIIPIEILLGFQYAWGIFDRVLQEKHGFTATQAQSVFAAQIVVFALAFAAAGWFLHRFGPRATTIIGGVLFGVGLAFAYISPIVTCVKWFPRYKGMVTGLVVAFYGCGSFFQAGAAKWLLSRDYTVFEVLNVFGIASIIGITLCALVLVDPPGTPGEPKKARLPKGVLRSGHFWALVVGFFAGTAAGLAIVGSIEKIGTTLETPERWLAMAVMAFAVGNTAGRIVWGIASEVIGTKCAVGAALFLQSACITAMLLFGANGPAFVVLTLFISFNYGANFVLFVADVSKTYGPDRVGSVFAMVKIAYVASGLVGAPLAGFSYDRWGSYTVSMCVAAGITFLGATAFLMLYRSPAQPLAQPSAPERC